MLTKPCLAQDMSEEELRYETKLQSLQAKYAFRKQLVAEPYVTVSHHTALPLLFLLLNQNYFFYLCFLYYEPCLEGVSSEAGLAACFLPFLGAFLTRSAFSAGLAPLPLLVLFFTGISKQQVLVQ